MRAFGDTFPGTLVLGGLFAYATWHTQHWIYTDLFVVPLYREYSQRDMRLGFAFSFCMPSRKALILVDTPD